MVPWAKQIRKNVEPRRNNEKTDSEGALKKDSFAFFKLMENSTFFLSDCGASILFYYQLKSVSCLLIKPKRKYLPSLTDLSDWEISSSIFFRIYATTYSYNLIFWWLFHLKWPQIHYEIFCSSKHHEHLVNSELLTKTVVHIIRFKMQ